MFDFIQLYFVCIRFQFLAKSVISQVLWNLLYPEQDNSSPERQGGGAKMPTH